MKKQILALMLAAGLVSCASNKAPVESNTDASNTVVATTDEGNGANNNDVNSDANETKTVNNSVFFEFNKYDVDAQYKDSLAANANYLVANSGAKTSIEGNTDDVGSVEYNLALGQKRADAVKKALISSGASAKQIEAVSFGKVKPKFDNSTDEGRAQNRRSDITYAKDQPQGYSLSKDGTPLVTEGFVTSNSK